LNGASIQRVKSYRFLGVILDQSLTWSKHLDMLENRINCVINVFRCIAGARWGVSIDGMLSFHTALIRQAIAYSIPVLKGLSRTSESRLTYMLARSLRVCLGLPRSTSSALVLVTARVPSIHILRTHEICRNFFRLSTRTLFNYIFSRKGTNFFSTLNSLPLWIPEQPSWIKRF
ncbi:hypothetical protein HPB47_000823, partial [Ixodes persulcatus]